MKKSAKIGDNFIRVAGKHSENLINYLRYGVACASDLAADDVAEGAVAIFVVNCVNQVTKECNKNFAWISLNINSLACGGSLRSFVGDQFTVRSKLEPIDRHKLDAERCAGNLDHAENLIEKANDVVGADKRLERSSKIVDIELLVAANKAVAGKKLLNIEACRNENIVDICDGLERINKCSDRSCKVFDNLKQSVICEEE